MKHAAAVAAMYEMQPSTVGMRNRTNSFSVIGSRLNMTRQSRLTLLLSLTACTGAGTADFGKPLAEHDLMKPDRRISVKDYSRNTSLKVLLCRTPSGDQNLERRVTGIVLHRNAPVWFH